MVTLSTIITWLTEKPAEEIVCWDTFEPRHGLIERYYRDQGKKDIRGEYDRAMYDVHGRKPYRIDPFARDLQKFNYSLHFTPLRFRPTASALIAFAQSDQWQIEPSGIPMYVPDHAVFNAIQDLPERPIDLAWQRRDTVTINDNSYQVRLYLYGNQWAGRSEWHTHRSVTIYIDSKSPDYEFIHGNFYLTCSGGISPIYSTFDAGQYSTQASRRLEEHDILSLSNHSEMIASWQREGERLVPVRHSYETQE